jgi:hypothetical protein
VPRQPDGRSWPEPRSPRQPSRELGARAATRYRITRGTVMNIHQLDPKGRRVAQWCFAPEGKLVIGDVLLAQKIALETMERKALTIANTQPWRW